CWGGAWRRGRRRWGRGGGAAGGRAAGGARGAREWADREVGERGIPPPAARSARRLSIGRSRRTLRAGSRSTAIPGVNYSTAVVSLGLAGKRPIHAASEPLVRVPATPRFPRTRR